MTIMKAAAHVLFNPQGLKMASHMYTRSILGMSLGPGRVGSAVYGFRLPPQHRRCRDAVDAGADARGLGTGIAPTNPSLYPTFTMHRPAIGPHWESILNRWEQIAQDPASASLQVFWECSLSIGAIGWRIKKGLLCIDSNKGKNKLQWITSTLSVRPVPCAWYRYANWRIIQRRMDDIPMNNKVPIQNWGRISCPFSYGTTWENNILPRQQWI